MGAHGDGDQGGDEAGDIGRVVQFPAVVIGVIGDAAGLVGFDLVAVDNPSQGRAPADFIGISLARNPSESQVVVIDQGRVILATFAGLLAPFRFHDVVFLPGVSGGIQAPLFLDLGIRLGSLVVNMQVSEFSANRREIVEAGNPRDTR